MGKPYASRSPGESRFAPGEPWGLLIGYLRHNNAYPELDTGAIIALTGNSMSKGDGVIARPRKGRRSKSDRLNSTFMCGRSYPVCIFTCFLKEKIGDEIQNI